MTVGAPLGPSAAAAGLTELIRIVVLSDIHATAVGSSESSVAQATAADLSANALVAARALLLEKFGHADLVLCPGDLVHRGDDAPLGWVWDQLHAIASELGAKLVACVGNHDLTRKPSDGRSPFDPLRALKPKFPAPGVHQSFWSDDHAIVTGPGWRVVALNTCALHGGYDPDESEHGAMHANAIAELRDSLDAGGAGAPVNICMCHHHLREWTHDGDRRTSHLHKGDQLIELLDRRPERWLIVHGHKHHPAIGYLGPTSSGPIGLSAGSLGVDVLGDTGTALRNQLHVVDVYPQAESQLGLRLAGEIMSYDWEPGAGWSRALARSGLPDFCAFGYRRDGHDLAGELAQLARRRKRRTLRWEELIDRAPRCGFLTPADRESLLAGVRRRGGGVSRSREDDAFLELTFA